VKLPRILGLGTTLLVIVPLSGLSSVHVVRAILPDRNTFPVVATHPALHTKRGEEGGYGQNAGHRLVDLVL
jgi:hypothetical protein